MGSRLSVAPDAAPSLLDGPSHRQDALQFRRIRHGPLDVEIGFGTTPRTSRRRKVGVMAGVKYSGQVASPEADGAVASSTADGQQHVELSRVAKTRVAETIRGWVIGRHDEGDAGTSGLGQGLIQLSSGARPVSAHTLAARPA